MADQVLSGAAKGAAAGAAVGGPIGAVVGGVFGAVAGIFGQRSSKYKRKARKEEQRAVEIQQSVQRRNIVRSAFIARSEGLAAAAAQESGGLQSSAAQGAISSVGTQAISNLKLFDALVARGVMQQYYMKKAGKNASYAGMAQGLGDIAVGLSGSFKNPFGGVDPGDATGAGNNSSRIPNGLPPISGEFPV
jgi:hypothetical protein